MELFEIIFGFLHLTIPLFRVWLGIYYMFINLMLIVFYDACP